AAHPCLRRTVEHTHPGLAFPAASASGGASPMLPAQTACRLGTIVRWMPKFSLSGLVRVAIELALLACLLTDAAGWIEIPALTQLERWVYDARVRVFLPRTRDPRIVIVDVDERSLQAEGYWPGGRDKLALLSHQLFARYRVRVVGFDTAFPE